MKRRSLLIFLCLAMSVMAKAQNWDYVVNSKEYYYGRGEAQSETEADQAALQDLVNSIVLHVSSDFTQIDDITTTNGTVDHKSKVQMCVNTYAQTSLANTQKLRQEDKSGITILRFIKKSELEEIYESRIERAVEMAERGGEWLERENVAAALQYYYWAYALVRSLQFPNKAKNREGKILVDWLPDRIKEILDNINVEYEERDGENVTLLFFYGEKPVQRLKFSYNDGRSWCVDNNAKDGRGQIEMIRDYETDVYHVEIEYEYKSESMGGDPEMESVLKVIPKKTFQSAQHTVHAKGAKRQDKSARQPTSAATHATAKAEVAGINLKPKESQTVEEHDSQAEILAQVIEAIKSRRYYTAEKYFTINGLERYNHLVKYGTARVVGTPRLVFFKGTKGTTVARGLQMAFTFKSGSKGNEGKNRYVEDVVFTFNKENKIDNVTFGLGQTVENDILCREASLWKDDTREMLMEFLENYKTAFCLEDIDYIEKVFSDDAIIIVGNIVQPKYFTRQKGAYETTIIDAGKEIIRESRYTKKEYIERLKRNFARSEFININFTNIDLELLLKFYPKEEIWAMQLGQEYNSTRYSDMGYLFLMVDMTNHDEPQIHVRTWQPNRVPLKDRYNSGNFFRD